MKKIIITTMMMLHIATASLIAANTNVIGEIKQLLEQVAQVSEGRQPHYPGSPEFTQLKKAVSKNKATILKNFVEIAPSDDHQDILFIAFWTLSDEDGVRCLSRLVDLLHDKAISENVFAAAMDNFDSDAAGFSLEQNYKNPYVRNVFQKLKLIDADNPDAVEYYDSILSGKAYKEQKKQTSTTKKGTPTNIAKNVEYWDSLAESALSGKAYNSESMNLGEDTDACKLICNTKILAMIGVITAGIIGVAVFVIRKIVKRKRSRQTETNKQA